MSKLTLTLSQAFGRAISAFNAGKLVEAEKLCQQVVNAKRDHFGALHLLALVQSYLGKREMALANYDGALALSPGSAEALSNRGLTLHELKRFDEAMASYDRALALRPNFAAGHYNRGNTLNALNRLEEALASFDRALALRPDYVEAHHNRGNTLKGLRRFEEALASYDRALALQPNLPEALSNRGLTLRELQRFEEALASYDRAVKLRPDFAEAHNNEAWCRLLIGDFDRGWEKNEWRWKTEQLKNARRNFTQPLWRGSNEIAGKTILLHAEQGFGDTIQFCRYVPLVLKCGARVVLEVPKPLHALMSTLPGDAQIVSRGDPLPEFEYQCPLMSLPLAFKTTLSNIPANIPYLKTIPDKSHFWRRKLGASDKLRVGLVWSGGFRPNQPELWHVNQRRNIPLAKFAPLKHTDIEFYSLQKGQPAETELAEMIRHKWDGPHIVDFTSLLNDFSDTAALVENLDLVISVDTSAAHLAGAIGKPAWILNRFDTDWRWLLDRTDSPWYPTVKLYRQETVGNWDVVIQRIKDDLIALAKMQCDKQCSRWVETRSFGDVGSSVRFARKRTRLDDY